MIKILLKKYFTNGWKYQRDLNEIVIHTLKHLIAALGKHPLSINTLQMEENALFAGVAPVDNHRYISIHPAKSKRCKDIKPSKIG